MPTSQQTPPQTKILIFTHQTKINGGSGLRLTYLSGPPKLNDLLSDAKRSRVQVDAAPTDSDGFTTAQAAVGDEMK